MKQENITVKMKLKTLMLLCKLHGENYWEKILNGEKNLSLYIPQQSP